MNNIVIQDKMSRLTSRCKQAAAAVKEMFYILIHPVVGFEDLKYKKSGSVALAFIVALFWFINTVMERQFTSFRFNTFDTENTNVLYIFISTVVMFLFFVLANWSLCTLFDGEGTLREIFIVTGYAIVPWVLSIFVSMVLSHFLLLEESAFTGFIVIAGVLWTVYLLFQGMMQIHSYSFFKTLLCLIGSIIGIALLLFLSFLLLLLFQQMFTFISSVYEELMLRFK